MLSPNILQSDTVPKEYDLQITNRKSSNTFIFTEMDLPGFHNKMKSSNTADVDQSALPFSRAHPRVQIPDRPRSSLSRVDKSKRLQHFYRKAIPSEFSHRMIITHSDSLPQWRKDSINWQSRR